MIDAANGPRRYDLRKIAPVLQTPATTCRYWKYHLTEPGCLLTSPQLGAHHVSYAADAVYSRHPWQLCVQFVLRGPEQRAVRCGNHRRRHIRSGPGARPPVPNPKARCRRDPGGRAEAGELPDPRVGGGTVRAERAHPGHPQSPAVPARHPTRAGQRASRHPSRIDRSGTAGAADPRELGPAVELDRAFWRTRLLRRRPIPLFRRLVAALPRDGDAQSGSGGDRRRHVVARRRRGRPDARGDDQRRVRATGGATNRGQRGQRLHQRNSSRFPPANTIRELRGGSQRNPSRRDAGLYSRGAPGHHRRPKSAARRSPLSGFPAQPRARRPAECSSRDTARFLPIQQIQQRASRHHRVARGVRRGGYQQRRKAAHDRAELPRQAPDDAALCAGHGRRRTGGDRHRYRERAIGPQRRDRG